MDLSPDQRHTVRQFLYDEAIPAMERKLVRLQYIGQTGANTETLLEAMICNPSEHYDSTLESGGRRGVTVEGQVVLVDCDTVTWDDQDIDGLERHYWQNPRDIYFLVYDMTKRISFEALPTLEDRVFRAAWSGAQRKSSWYNRQPIRDELGPQLGIWYVVESNADAAEDMRAVTVDEGENFARAINAPFLQLSGCAEFGSCRNVLETTAVQAILGRAGRRTGPGGSIQDEPVSGTSLSEDKPKGLVASWTKFAAKIRRTPSTDN